MKFRYLAMIAMFTAAAAWSCSEEAADQPAGPQVDNGNTQPSQPNDNSATPETPVVPAPPTPPPPAQPEHVYVDMSKADTVTAESCESTYSDVCDGNIAKFCNDQGKVVHRDCAKAGAEYVCQKFKHGDYVYADCLKPCDPAAYRAGSICHENKAVTFSCTKAEDGKFYETSLDDACDAYCHDGVCVAELPKNPGDSCDPAVYEPNCIGANGYNCVDGKITVTACTNSETCAVPVGGKSTQCTVSCVPGQTKETYGCVDNGGRHTTQNKVCRPNKFSKYFLFTETEVCRSSCSGGVCDVSELPVEGAACDPETFTDLCAHNSAYYCRIDTKRIAKMACGTGDMKTYPVCRMKKGTSFADCVIPCDKGSEPILNCSVRRDENGKKLSYTDNFICEEGADGAWYYFNSQETCENTCSDGKCQ